jgi:hypothetical protein
MSEEHFVDTTQLLDKAGLTYLKRSDNQTRITIDKATIAANAGTIEAIANLVRESWED